jgi:hypothetical protein
LAHAASSDGISRYTNDPAIAAPPLSKRLLPEEATTLCRDAGTEPQSPRSRPKCASCISARNTRLCQLSQENMALVIYGTNTDPFDPIKRLSGIN